MVRLFRLVRLKVVVGQDGLVQLVLVDSLDGLAVVASALRKYA